VGRQRLYADQVHLVEVDGGVYDHRCFAIRTIHYGWYEDLFGQAIGFYRRPPLPFMQIVWPDRDRLWPWEDGVDGYCAAAGRRHGCGDARSSTSGTEVRRLAADAAAQPDSL
jgi:Domain of unknown function (DUF4262)